MFDHCCRTLCSFSMFVHDGCSHYFFAILAIYVRLFKSQRLFVRFFSHVMFARTVRTPLSQEVFVRYIRTLGSTVAFARYVRSILSHFIFARNCRSRFSMLSSHPILTHCVCCEPPTLLLFRGPWMMLFLRRARPLRRRTLLSHAMFARSLRSLVSSAMFAC